MPGQSDVRIVAALNATRIVVHHGDGHVFFDGNGRSLKAPDVLALLDEGDRGRVVIVTSDHSPAVAAKARELGVVRLLKPLKAEQARQVLGRLLG